nr:ER membrane protein complex subunit 2-like [Ipomoea batatas]
MDEARRRIGVVYNGSAFAVNSFQDLYGSWGVYFTDGLWFWVGGLYKQAAFCYDELIFSHPMVPLYDIAYANLECGFKCDYKEDKESSELQSLSAMTLRENLSACFNSKKLEAINI